MTNTQQATSQDQFAKDQKKRIRQEMKLRCLDLALNIQGVNGDPDKDSILAAAKAFYEFART